MWYSVKPAAIHLHKNLYRLFEDDCPSVFGTNNGCPASSVDEIIAKSLVRIYPNPVSDILKIESTADGTVTVRNILGEVVKRVEIKTGDHRIDFSSVSPGHYTVTFESEATIQNFSLIVSR